MWKIVKFIAVGFFVLLLLLIGVLYWQKDNIIEAAISHIEKTYDAKIDYENTNLSLFSNFPNISFEIDSIAISHISQNPGEEAIFTSDKNGIALSISNVWSSPYQISDIYFINPKISIHCDNAGNCNYDAFTESGQEDDNTESTESGVSFSIDNLWWTGAEIVYTDSLTEQTYTIENWDAFWKIMYLEEHWTIDMNIDSALISGTNGNVQLIPKVALAANGKTFYSPDSGYLEFREHNYKLNGLELRSTGKVKNLNKTPHIDWNINAPSNNIKSILALFPDLYDNYAEGITTSGQFDFNASILGNFDTEKDDYPSINSTLNIRNGKIQYKAKPKPISDLNINLDIQKSQGSLSSLKLSMDKAMAKFGDAAVINHSMTLSPFSGSKVNTGETALNFTESDIERTFPFYEESLFKGTFDFKSNYRFTLDQIEREDWENISLTANLQGREIEIGLEESPPLSIAKAMANINKNTGTLELQNTQYGPSHISFVDCKGPITDYLFGHSSSLSLDISANAKMLDLNPFMETQSAPASTESSNQTLDLSPYNFKLSMESDELRYDSYDLSQFKMSGIFQNQKLQISNVSGIYQSSSIECKGAVSSIAPYLNGKGDLSIDLDCSADEFDLWAYMSSETEGAETGTTTTTEEEPFELPGDINMSLNYIIESIDYDKFQLQNVIGAIQLKEKEITIEPTRMSALGGDMTISGLLSQKGRENLQYHFDFANRNADFKRAFESVDMVKQFAPVFEHMFGKFNSQVSFDGKLASNLDPILSSVSAQGMLNTLNARFGKFDLLEKLTPIVGMKFAEKFIFKETKNWFSIENGTVFLDPVDFTVGDDPWHLEGYHDIEGGLEYVFRGPLSVGQLKNSQMGREALSSVENALSKMKLPAIPENGKLEVEIELSGSATNPNIQFRPFRNVDEQVKSMISSKKEEKKVEIKETVEKEKEELKRLAKEQKASAKKDLKKEVKSLIDSGKTTNRLDSLKKEAEKKKKKVKKKFKKWNPFD
ncbi:MAG: hypothetical protein GVY20_09265 [Bacteroidetes bacterium]|jgi:hypothetical protein|nr:hypothetical protein [Bacteroidota bacterium]